MRAIFFYFAVFSHSPYINGRENIKLYEKRISFTQIKRSSGVMDVLFSSMRVGVEKNANENSEDFVLFRKKGISIDGNTKLYY